MRAWSFPPNNFGTAAGANDGAIDAFAGNKLSSVVREIIQNSLDVPKFPDKPVKISFSVEKLSSKNHPEFSGILPHLEACVEAAKRQGLEDVVKYYESAAEQIVSSEEVNVLCVHDHNTIGLTGPIDEEYGSWFALTKGSGMSQKDGVGSLGSFGHGSKAPFAFSATRSVFYLTKIDGEKGSEHRFQGKSILQSHKDPANNDITTQGTGFFGVVDRLQPLLNDDVPSWAMKLRQKVTNDTGTSIFVPYTDYRAELYLETTITVVANFFYAIMTGALEVTVGDDTINSENLEEWFRHCEVALANEQEAIDVPHIEDCFKSINTILSPTHSNIQELKGYGRLKWYLRVGEDLEKRVGVARSSGMLITRRPPDLHIFRNVKQFDMFVCVEGNEGSDFLKTLENPQHDNFEFDRIRLTEENKAAKSKYKRFQQRVRKIIADYATLDSEAEEAVPDLGFLFSDVSDLENDVNEKVERGEKLLIRDGAFKRKIPSNPVAGGPNGGANGGTFGKGLQGGKKKKKTGGGGIQNPTGVTPVNGGQGGEGSKAPQKYLARNLRVVHEKLDGNHAQIFFDSPINGICRLQTKIIGENGSQNIPLIHEKKTTQALQLELKENERYRLEVEFGSNVKDMALEVEVIKSGELE